MSQMTPAIWVISSDAKYGLSLGMRYPSFYGPAQQARLERLRQAKMLFTGQHREYFLGEDRSQFEFRWVRVSNGRLTRMYFTHNLLGLVATKSADLLLGQEPILSCSNEIQQSKIDALQERSNLHAVFYAAALECAYQAETFLEAVVGADRQVYLQSMPAEEVFPVGPLLPNRQYAQYDRYQIANWGSDHNPIWLLLITHIMCGKIVRECWQLKADKSNGPGEKQNRVPLDAWAKATVAPLLLDQESTGIAVNTVTWIPNQFQGVQVVSDYDGVIDKQDVVNAKDTQLSRVLARHADPKIAMLEYQADDQGNVRTDQEVLFVRSKDEIPAYITWEAQLDAAMKDRDQAIGHLLILTETSPVLLGIQEGAAPDAYKKVRLQAANSLTKAQRKAVYWKAGIRQAVGVCLDLEAAQPGNRFDRSPISVKLSDGIPIDEGEQATTQATLIAAGALSIEGAVEQRFGGDAAGAQKELERLAAQRAQQTPSVLFGEPSPAATDTMSAGGAEAPTTSGGDPALEASVQMTGQEIQTTQDTVLNGTQIASATAIVMAVVEGTMPRDAGMGQLQVLFNLDTNQAAQIMGSAGLTKPPVQPVVAGGNP